MTIERRERRPAIVCGGIALLCALALSSEARSAQPTPATSTAVVQVAADASGYGGQLALPIGGSKILRFNQPMGRVMVGDPKVADVVPLSNKTLYVLGKAAGASSLTVMPAGDSPRPIAAMDLRIGYDIEGMQRAVGEIMPGEPIRISAQGDGLVLSGTASSSAQAARMAALAEHYAPQKVVNLMAIRGAEQVMLSVHVAEVQRSALRQLGISQIAGAWSDVATIGDVSTGLSFNPDAVANLLGLTKIGDNFGIAAVFEALERKGYATTLAEPTLTALSGETATFFAGGEFPVPVPQLQGVGQALITVEYKQYGVSVGFTPTVYGDTINLLVSPEVSALDPENAVQLQGFRIPGITTRRAKTTVELRNGQSFAIAGLIRREFSDSLRGLPGAANLPLFGALFRSTAYQKNDSEVVIIVTAHLAKPTTRANLLLPTDLSRAPTDTELLLNNVTSAPQPARRPALQQGPAK
jgi:pilus assembly protein CpaC